MKKEHVQELKDAVAKIRNVQLADETDQTLYGRLDDIMLSIEDIVEEQEGE